LNNITETKKEKPNTEKTKFTDNSKLVQSSFIIGIIASTLTIIFGVIVSITQKPGLIAYYVILSLIAGIAFIGLFFGLLSLLLKKGISIYNILGISFGFIVIAYHIVVIVLFVRSGI